MALSSVGTDWPVYQCFRSRLRRAKSDGAEAFSVPITNSVRSTAGANANDAAFLPSITATFSIESNEGGDKLK